MLSRAMISSVSGSGDPACLALLTYRPYGWWNNAISFIKNSWLQRSITANSHGSKSYASLKNQYWRINRTITVYLSGYLKIDEQRKCKAHEAAKRGLQRLLMDEKLQGNSPSGNSLAQHPLKSGKWFPPVTLKVFSDTSLVSSQTQRDSS